MNYLAHLHLSYPDEKEMVGNFIADGVKGNQLLQYDSEITRGIKLHRFIDSFTDSHPAVEEVKKLLRPFYHKYAGVISDVFLDHVLAKHFESFSPLSLNEFSSYAYSHLSNYKHVLPYKFAHMLPFMISQNWLGNYQHIEGIRRSLEGLSHRATYQSNMEYAYADLELHYPEVEKHFLVFYPALMEAVKEQRSLLVVG